MSLIIIIEYTANMEIGGVLWFERPSRQFSNPEAHVKIKTIFFFLLPYNGAGGKDTIFRVVSRNMFL